jgi:hypothetical protein
MPRLAPSGGPPSACFRRLARACAHGSVWLALLGFRRSAGFGSRATTGDNDYVAQTGTLPFKLVETTKTITILVKGDTNKEADELFYVDLFGNSSNAWLAKRRGLGTIVNDD